MQSVLNQTDADLISSARIRNTNEAGYRLVNGTKLPKKSRYGSTIKGHGNPLKIKKEFIQKQSQVHNSNVIGHESRNTV